MNDSKKSTIKETLKNTIGRRSLLDCKMYELKLDLSHMSKAKINNINLLFLESKWLYNHILSQENIIDFDTKINKVSALDKDRKPVTKELNVIGSQIKQSLHSRMLDSTIALAKLKKHGFKTGKLKFKSEIKSIPLKQYGNTYKFNETKPNYVKVQGLKGYYKLNGMKQISKNTEFANATLIHKNKNFYLALTCFIPKQVKNFTQKEVGIDFGIESTITLSNGEKFRVDVPENKRSRRLRHKLSRKQGSKKYSIKSESYFKNLNLLNKSVNTTNNQKKDIKNKIVSKIVNTYETVCVQDESIKQWKDTYFGKQVHNSVLGGIMADLQRKSHTLKVVDKYEPTTQLCPKCFKLNKFGLEQRIYVCSCGYIMDRDIHSAQNVLGIGMGRFNLKDISKVHTDYMHYKTPMEGLTSAPLGEKPVPMKSEAHEFIRG